jgi:multiple sugar transport system permease protein/cellobiose transport system permease protein
MKKISINILLFIICLISLFPFFVVLILGTYSTSEIGSSLKIVPGPYILENLKTVFSAPYINYYFNSIYIAVSSVFLTLLLGSMCAYGLAKYQFRGKNTILAIIIATMLLPGQLGLVAFVIQMKNMGMLGTHWPLILPAAQPFMTFWIYSGMRNGVPNELLDSARIDGCNEYRLFFQIVIPIIRPALGTMGLLAFLGSWNNLMLPMIILNKTIMYTLPVGIRNFGNAYLRNIGAQILAVNLAIFPLLVVFAIFNKNMIRGITEGAIKS